MDRPSRREILGKGAKLAAAAAAFQVLPRPGRAGAARADANSRLNIAGVGVGGMGASNLRQLESENIAALCDVDTDYAAKTLARYPDARVYTDFREMLERQPEIDAVLIATPDHTHAVIAAACMRAGKHVYCQKPLTHTVGEARRLAEIAKETGVVTQMGIQGHSGGDARKVVEWIRGGVIGPMPRQHDEIDKQPQTRSLAHSPGPLHGGPWT